MLTADEAADALNLVEESAANSLAADAWLCIDGTGGIGRIGRDDPDGRRVYAAHELPALAISAKKLAEEAGDVPAGVRECAVALAIDVVCTGADMAAAASRARSIACRIARWLADQTIVGGNRLDGLLDAGDGDIERGTAEIGEPSDGGRTGIVRGRVRTVVRLRATIG